MKKQEYRFVTNNGKELNLDDLESLISLNSIHVSATHLRICEYVSNRILTGNEISEVVKKALVNILYFKSFNVYLLSMLVFYNEHTDDRICAVSKGVVNRISADLLSRYGITSKRIVEDNNFINISRKTLLVKAFIHKFFYLLYKIVFFKKNTYDRIVRSWVEVSYTLFDKEYCGATIFVYPFGINISRQVGYVKMLIKNKFEFKLIGLNYSIIELVKILVIRQNRDFRYLKFESDAYLHHAYLLGKLRARYVFTTDEFEACGIVFNDTLINFGVHVVNKAHGVGMYSPYISYSTFEVYNKEQIEYYKVSSPNINYVINRDIKEPLEAPANIQGLPKAIVYIHSNVEDIGAKCEIRIQNLILQSLENVSKKEGLPLILKIHPNTSDKKVAILQDKGFACEKDVNKIVKRYRPIFVTIISTAFYDFRLLGEFYFYRDKYNNPTAYFGKEIQTFEINSLDETLKRKIYE